jgi:hypothetical protein
MSTARSQKDAVMAGLGPAIHDLPGCDKGVDARHKATAVRHVSCFMLASQCWGRREGIVGVVRRVWRSARSQIAADLATVAVRA